MNAPECHALLDTPNAKQFLSAIVTDDGQVRFTYAMNINDLALLAALLTDAALQSSKALAK